MPTIRNVSDVAQSIPLLGVGGVKPGETFEVESEAVAAELVARPEFAAVAPAPAEKPAKGTTKKES